MHVKNDIVIDSQAEHQPNQEKLAICLKRRRIEPAVMSGLITCEHTYKTIHTSRSFSVYLEDV